jgi:hypothetical protein
LHRARAKKRFDFASIGDLEWLWLRAVGLLLIQANTSKARVDGREKPAKKSRVFLFRFIRNARNSFAILFLAEKFHALRICAPPPRDFSHNRPFRVTNTKK